MRTLAAVLTLLLLPTLAWATNPSETETVPDEVLVDFVTDLILEVHSDSPECGGYCGSDRNDRAYLPDWSDSTISPEEARYTAEALVWTSTEYDIPLTEVLATAYQESSFRYMAVGGGTECGMFQQTTLYFRWNTYDNTEIVESRDPVNEVTTKVEGDVVTTTVDEDYPGHDRYTDAGALACTYLLDPYNAGWQFAMKYHRQVNNNSTYTWSQYYNSGDDQIGYANRHRSYAINFEHRLAEVEAMYFAMLDAVAEGKPSESTTIPVSATIDESYDTITPDTLPGKLELVDSI